MPAPPPSTHIRSRFPWGALRALRWAAAALLAGNAARSAEDAPKVTVQALPRFENASCQPTQEGLEVRARLIDDVGNPLAEAPIAIEPTTRGAPIQAVPCGQAARARPGTLRTDGSGEICFWVSGALSGSLTLRFRGDALHLATQAELPLEPVPGELRLAFDSPALELSLDQPEQRLTLELSAEGSASPSLPEIALQIEEGGQLRSIETRDWVRSGNSLRFSVDSAALGGPGPARLLARTVGAQPPALAEAVALRSVSVQLEQRSLTSGRDAAELRVQAQSRGGVPSSGWLDASSDGQSLASSPVVAGVGTLQLLLNESAPARILVRYHSDDPWWLPGAPLSVELSGPAAMEPSRWPWLVLLAPVGYVCLRALERPGVRKPRRSARRAPPKPAAPAERAAAALVAPAGWSGAVTDAHDGSPIAGAHIQASLPSLTEEPAGASTTSDTEGHFQLPALPEPIPEGAQLVVRSRLHTDFRRPLPPQGRVNVTLTLRRRALLARLVRWARAAGPPWHRATEPTPAEVADVALRRGDPKTAHWAEGIQRAAFANGEVDEQREAALHAQEPAWQHTGERPERLPSD